ncbi:MAG: hypothetical protein EBV79_06710 [Betaproteobacteria bacterium]|nr:hypothetical protein [Betaproteobacteria bacterium]
MAAHLLGHPAASRAASKNTQRLQRVVHPQRCAALMALWLVLAWGMRFMPATAEATSHGRSAVTATTADSSAR